MVAPARTLGVLGGMGPAATAEFLRLLAVGAPVATDQDHPRVLVLSDPGIADRSAAILANSPAPVARIGSGLDTLVEWGADVLAVPCNTAHVFIENLRPRPSAPLVDIVDAALGEAVRRSPEGCWLTATAGTVISGLYQRRARRMGYRVAVPDTAAQSLLDQVRLLVKGNRYAEAARLFTQAAGQLGGRRDLPMLGACTELPLAYREAGLPPEMMISSLDALAGACLDKLYGELTADERDVSLSDRVFPGGEVRAAGVA